jgi:poly(3-hydroxyalkanoate) depolymerase
VDSYKPEIQHIKIGRQVFRTARWEGDPNVRPLLFFNGIGANLETVVPLARRLNRSRDLITFDPPGIGESPDALFPYRMWMMAKSASRILDEMDYTTLDVYGVSWGGGLAQQFAFQYRNRVRCLVLAATSPGVTMFPGNLSVLAKMMTPTRYSDPEYLHKNAEVLYGKMPEERLLKHSKRLRPPTSRGYLYQLLAMTGWSSLPFLPLLSQPTLILAGDRDKIVPLANARVLNALIPNSRLQVIKGAGHLFFVSRADEKVPMIRNFLRQHKTRRGEMSQNHEHGVQLDPNPEIA